MTEQDRWEWLDEIVMRIGLGETYLFGGSAFDWSSQCPGLSDDVDLQAAGGPAAADRLLRCVERDPGAVLLSGPRDFWIFHTVPVQLFVVRIDGVMLDINLMDTTVRPGHFSVETVRWRIADRTVEDPNSAIGDTRRARLVTGLDSDNPIRILTRLIRLSKKYSLLLNDHPQLLSTALALRERVENWRPESRFHGEEAWDVYEQTMNHIFSTPPERSALRRELAGLGFADLQEQCRESARGDAKGDERHA